MLKYIKQVDMAAKETEELKENAEELFQFRNLSHNFGRKLEELEKRENRQYLRGISSKEAL